MVELIILDMHGTIVGRGNNATPRRGFSSFMSRNADKKIVIATDDDVRSAIDRNLNSLGILQKIARVYDYDTMINVSGYFGKRKDLKRIVSDFNCSPDNAVFISDGEKDFEDAKRAKVNFIHVPYYEVMDEPFSFESVNLSRRMKKYSDLRS